MQEKKSNFDAVLWDIDGTLLDFLYAQRIAITKCLAEIGIQADDEMRACYSRINDDYWKKLERMEVTKEELLTGRFQAFFDVYGIRDDVLAFRNAYERELGNVYQYQENAPEVCQRIQDLGIRQFVVTNGIEAVQQSKMRLSGLAKYMEDVFISERIGFPKPQKEFFEACFLAMESHGITDKRRMIIIGDSLSSDIKGGVLNGIKSCWYRSTGEYAKHRQTKLYEEYRPDYEIEHLNDIFAVLGMGI